MGAGRLGRNVESTLASGGWGQNGPGCGIGKVCGDKSWSPNKAIGPQGKRPTAPLEFALFKLRRAAGRAFSKAAVFGEAKVGFRRCPPKSTRLRQERLGIQAIHCNTAPQHPLSPLPKPFPGPWVVAFRPRPHASWGIECAYCAFHFGSSPCILSLSPQPSSLEKLRPIPDPTPSSPAQPTRAHPANGHGPPPPNHTPVTTAPPLFVHDTLPSKRSSKRAPISSDIQSSFCQPQLACPRVFRRQKVGRGGRPPRPEACPTKVRSQATGAILIS